MAVIQQCENEIQRLKSERARWVALFGPSGHLGYNSDLRKYIRPQGRGQAVEALSDIILEARLEHGVPVVLEEIALASGDPTALQEQRRREFLQVLHQPYKKT